MSASNGFAWLLAKIKIQFYKKAVPESVGILFSMYRFLSRFIKPALYVVYKNHHKPLLVKDYLEHIVINDNCLVKYKKPKFR